MPSGVYKRKLFPEKCSVDDCNKKRMARGWCPMHYRRWRVNGSPLEGGRGTLRERFEEKYTPVLESGCWIWTANTIKQGYGRIYVEGKPRLAHRMSWELYKGPIPKGLHVLHKCDVPACVNPAHLFIGTHQDNIKDREAKNRGNVSRGEAQGNSVLTEKAVKEIRTSDRPQKYLSKKYGVTVKHISDVNVGKSWAWVK